MEENLHVVLSVRFSTVIKWHNQIRKIRGEFTYKGTLYFEGVSKQLWVMDKGTITTNHRPEETRRNWKELEGKSHVERPQG